MDVDPLSWILIIIFLILSFFFSMSETALSCCNRFKIQVRADEGHRTSKLVIKICNKFDRALTAVLIGNNIAAILISIFSSAIFFNFLKDRGINEFGISLISSIIVSLIVYIFGDAFPKMIAKAIPDTICSIIAYPVYLLLWILTYIIPVTLLFDGIVKLVEKLFKVKKEEFTEEDFNINLETATDEGVIEEEQAEIIQSALDFADTKVKEVFTPKEKMVALDINGLTHKKMKEFILSNSYSRIPIYEDNPNNIIGVLFLKRYFKEISKNKKCSIRNLLQEPYFVTQNVMIDNLFNGFKEHHTHLAIVVDKNKTVLGMVTMEDVLEELVDGIGEPNQTKGLRK